MNYYERHIGDYLKDTAHLSLLEHGIYTRLMDVYYTREGPLPDDQVARLIGARTKEERDALQDVLGEFFTRTEQGWAQDRCDREIERYQDKQRKAAASANARWGAKRPQSEGNANASETHDADGMRSQCDGNAPNHQTPDTREEKKPSASSPARLPTCPTDRLVDLYHEVLPELPRVRLATDGRKRALQKVWTWCLTSRKADGTPRAVDAEQALAWFRDYFERTRLNDFLMGRTPRSGEHANWRCDLDFLLTERGMKHVIEKTQETA